jgi:hypothetical protein
VREEHAAHLAECAVLNDNESAVCAERDHARAFADASSGVGAAAAQRQ